MAVMVARQGRELQRYDSVDGRRLVVGCVPYRFNRSNQSIEVLVISSQKGHGMMFPKGGWELDETVTQAASREAVEEAGVQGNVEDVLGHWKYKSRRYDKIYEGIMFPLHVTEELPNWAEMDVRKRRWVTVAEMREGCQHWWMVEALDELERRLSKNVSNKDNISAKM